MKAGVLTEQVAIERLIVVDDPDYGPQPGAWTNIATVSAAVEPLRGREYLAAAAAVSELTARIRMRYRPGITSADRVVHGSTIYGITSVIHVKSARRELELMCRSFA